jgi:hypothetical protein
MNNFSIVNLKNSCSLVFLASLLFGSSVLAGEKETFLKNLTGCFNVTFRYVEDGANDQAIENLYEWISPLKDAPGALQHIGVVEGQAFKHWLEEWSVLPNGDLNQKVTGPYGDFRYECAAPAKFNQWRCSVTAAPKPRRDKERTDYVRLDRENTLQITPNGWVQSENNTKLDKDGNAVSNELGWNEYQRVDESKCQPAKDFLQKGE